MSDGRYWFFTMELVDGVNFLDRATPRRRVGTQFWLKFGYWKPCRYRHDPRRHSMKDLRLALKQLAEGLNALHENGKPIVTLNPRTYSISKDVGHPRLRPGRRHRPAKART